MGVVLVVVRRVSYVCPQVTQGTDDGGENMVEVGRLAMLSHRWRSKANMFAHPSARGLKSGCIIIYVRSGGMNRADVGESNGRTKG